MMDIMMGSLPSIARIKFGSWLGWPSFLRPIAKDVVHYYQDHSRWMERIEVRFPFRQCPSRHVFTENGPKDRKGVTLLYQFDFSLRFIPKEEMEQEGYGKFILEKTLR